MSRYLITRPVGRVAYVTYRESKHDARAGRTIGATLDPDTAAMRLDYPLGDSQSHARPGWLSPAADVPVARRAEELVEDALAQLRRDAPPLVLDRNADRVALGRRGQGADGRPRLRILRRVID